MKKTIVSLAVVLALVFGITSTVKAANVRFLDYEGQPAGFMMGVYNTPRDISVNDPAEVEGYSFTGWATDDEDLTIENNQVSVPWRNPMLPGASREDWAHIGDTLDAYATREAIPYTIDYDLDGGEADNPTEYTIESEDIVIEAPTKDGYEFVGWTNVDGEEIGTEFTIESGSTGDILLIANWEVIEYNITYDLDGGEVEEENPETYTVEDSFTLNNPTKDGYKFVGWINVEGEDVGTEVTVEEGTTGDLEFTAKWEKEPEEEEEEEKVTKNPKTGDGIVAYATMLGLSVAGLAVLVKTRK